MQEKFSASLCLAVRSRLNLFIADLPTPFVNWCLLKDTHRKKPPKNKVPALSKGMNIDIWLVSTSNQLFMRGS